MGRGGVELRGKEERGGEEGGRVALGVSLGERTHLGETGHKGSREGV